MAAPEDDGKSRPASVIQSDLFRDDPSVTLCLMTSDLRDTPLFRFTFQPGSGNGPDKVSRVMVDKVVTVANSKIGQRIGKLNDKDLTEVTRLLALCLGIARTS